MKRYYSLLILSLFATIALAQKLTIQAPSHAEVGRRIQVKYVLNTTDYENIQPDGDFNGFELQFGPSVSQMSSFSSVNGRTTQSSSATFTYTLMPVKEGTYTLPSATVTSGGQKIKSGTAKIEVLPASGGSGQGSAGSGNGGNGGGGRQQGGSSLHTPTQNESISSSDIYFTATASKTHVYEQEAILITYKLYSLVSVEQLSGDIPQLDGFHTQEIEQPQQQSFKLERVGNKNYGTVVWREYVVFPQRTGKLTIPAVDFTADIVVQSRYVDPIDAFFNGGGMMQRVQKKIKAPSIDITVDALPQRPANFSGAVGKNFSISGKLSPQQVDANDATTLSLNISGTGNIKLMNAPVIAWPHDFEEYDPKREEQTKITKAGSQGSVSYEYVAVPHHAGKFHIAPVEFCYFDTDKKQYVTLRTDSFELGVAKVEGASASSAARTQEDIKELGDDIHYIKKGELSVVEPGDTMFGSLRQLLWYVGILLLFLVVMILFHRQAKANADVVGRRGRRASKAAVKRLRVAGKMMKAGDDQHFYDEVMRAMWGYVADKLNLPATDLNKDNVSEMLLSRGVEEETTRQFLDTLGECEFARFAPGDTHDNMEHLYNAASDIIGQIDESLSQKKKKTTNSSNMKNVSYLLLFLATLGVTSPSYAADHGATSKHAEQLYADGQFEEALDIYKRMAKHGEGAELYYNMANCYFRLDSIPQALLWYERAYMLNPGDGDIRYNLQYARSKTIDKIVPEEDIFFVRWYKSLLNTFSAEGWTKAGILFFALALAALCMFFFLEDIRLRKTGFYGSLITVVFVLLSNLFAWQQVDRRENHDRAIVFDSSVSCKSSPNQAGKELFLLHEGTTVSIIDRSVKNWLQVRLPDGKQGWIASSSVEVI